jgi:SAM-dependent methyltransferase
MPQNNAIESHYAHGSLLDAIEKGVLESGKTVRNVRVEDLAPVDEFHIGGRVATERFLRQLDIDRSHHVLDVGCGLGGASRFAARHYGCRITGIDLTQEYVETGQVLCSWVGLNDRIHLEIGDATALSYEGDTFDRAFMMHVGMNISDKRSLAHELHRVLRPGGKLGIYDIMSMRDGQLQFPVPWATEPENSVVATPAEYRNAVQGAGFRITAEHDRRRFALDFFSQLQTAAASPDGPPPLGLHVLMGSTAAVKVSNMIENVSRGLIAPVELIAEKGV